MVLRLRILLLLALLLGAFPSNAIAAENNSAPMRSLVDRPDDLVGYQIRLIYVVPADVSDRNLDTNGTISKWIEEVRKISRVQTGLTPRFDTYQDKFDIGFLKSKYTVTQLIGPSGTLAADDLLRKELPIAEQNSLKGIGFIIDGKVTKTSYCGYANLPGKYFTAWLGESCWEDSDWYNNRPHITWIARTILHEWLHNLGVEHTCITDDLMWGGGCEAIAQGDKNSIDEKRESYLRADKSGVDISQLPVWEETIKTGLISLEFQSKTKSSNPRRNSASNDDFWGSFNLSKKWASASSVIWKCEVKTSKGVILASSIVGGMCESKIPSNIRIGTRIYMSVAAEGLWHKSAAVMVFDVLGDEGEERYCESTSCVFGETIKVDVDLCFTEEGFVKLQLKQNETWIDLKTHRLYKGYSGCRSSFPYFASTTLKGLPVGTHILRWTHASDRGFTELATSYKEFQRVIQPEVGK